MNTFLHVGCGRKNKTQAGPGLQSEDWREIRLDIDPAVAPDIVGSITDMSAVPNDSVDAVFSSHNIEHLYPHEVPVALGEFARVLKADGFALITCPDLRSVCALVAQDKLTETAYTSAAGAIAPLDILYGHRKSMAQGNLFMAHRCGFTLRTLLDTLRQAGFSSVTGRRRPAQFDLWAMAFKQDLDALSLETRAGGHFPQA